MTQRVLFMTFFLVFWSASPHGAPAQETQPAGDHPAMAHKVITPEKVAWTHPPNFPTGFDLAVVEGDPYVQLDGFHRVSPHHQAHQS